MMNVVWLRFTKQKYASFHFYISNLDSLSKYFPKLFYLEIWYCFINGRKKTHFYLTTGANLHSKDIITGIILDKHFMKCVFCRLLKRTCGLRLVDVMTYRRIVAYLMSMYMSYLVWCLCYERRTKRSKTYPERRVMAEYFYCNKTLTLLINLVNSFRFLS